MPGISQMAAQLVTSRVVLSPTELVTQKARNIAHGNLLENTQRKINTILLLKIE
jgi:hypothetical protein